MSSFPLRHLKSALPLIGLVVALVVLGNAGAAATDVVCGQVVVEDTTLTHDLTNCPGDGIIVDAAGVTLDLNGHTISGSGTGRGIVLTQGPSTTVTNGTVRRFDTGILVKEGGSFLPSGFRINFMNVAENRRGIEVSNFAADTHITDSTVTGNAETGIAFDAFIPNASVERVTVSKNGLYGISTLDNVGGTYLDNRFLANGLDGLFITQSSGIVIGNVARRNGGNGINLFEPDGLSFGPGYFIADNVADNNGALGISACIRTIDIGGINNCAPGMIDGGGNAAKHNGNPLECVNIVCAFNQGMLRAAA